MVCNVGLGAYALVASNVLTLISTGIAIYRYGKKGDKIKAKKGRKCDKREIFKAK